METLSLAELRNELKEKSPAELREICLRLAKFKKANKELLHYLVVEADDEDAYRNKAKEDLKARFETMPRNSLFLTTKYIRKTLRLAKQYSSYSKDPVTAIELLLCFCTEMHQCRNYWNDYQALVSLYQRQLIQIKKMLKTLHEDLQYDYAQELEQLQ